MGREPRRAFLVLAAGRSRRFGSDKLMATVEGGETLLAAALRPLVPWKGDVHVMVRADAPERWRLVEAWGAQPHLSPHADRGIGQTLSDGIALLAGHYEACLVCLGDMPALRRRTFAMLWQRLHGDALIVPRRCGRWGHPVGFGQRYFPELLRLQGDRGARSVLEANKDRIIFVDVDDDGIAFDVDTPADLRRAPRAESSDAVGVGAVRDEGRGTEMESGT
ncbi:MAG: Molybdenum cofactor guanylyltransferase [Rhodocyclaceae bacterium]|nr:nucleotidyltransferase family protein [Rhodocyclaceae bacterium]MCG3185692.1 Molybdenum cofactor guanylyltransferase [Rhodocyclaceae bacterium]